MNETFTNKSRTLQELNDDEFLYRMPAFIILVLLMFPGVIGNGLVIYVYGFRLRTSIVQYFVALLAIFDMGSCSIGIPLCLIVLRLPLLFPNDELCKFTEYFIYFTTMASVFTLLVISIERYKRLCQPTKTTMSERFARYIAAIISLLAALIASPTLIIYKRIIINVTDSDDLGYKCLSDPENKFKRYFWIFLAIVIIITISIMLWLYVLIWKRIRRYYIHVKSAYTPPVITNCISALSASARKKLIQNTKISFAVTLLFVVSFIPVATFVIVVHIFSHNSQLSKGGKMYMHIVVSLWALNSSLNPFVYGFYCRDFRRVIINIFKPSPTPANE